MKSLDFNLMIKVPSMELVITDLDMAFDITKTNDSACNTCELIVWNLAYSNFARLVETDEIVELYSFYGQEEPCLAFRGYISELSTEFHDSSPDVPTRIRLLDGKKAYKTSYINNNYRGEVSSTKIITDCVQAMGLEMPHLSENFPEKTYIFGYKAVGKPQNVLASVCRALKIGFSIQNDVFVLILPDSLSVSEYLPTFNPENSQAPRSVGKNEVRIRGEFKPYLSPNDFVQCDFEEYKGVERVQMLHSWGDNFSKAPQTEVLIRITKDENV